MKEQKEEQFQDDLQIDLDNLDQQELQKQQIRNKYVFSAHFNEIDYDELKQIIGPTKTDNLSTQ